MNFRGNKFYNFNTVACLGREGGREGRRSGGGGGGRGDCITVIVDFLSSTSGCVCIVQA